MSGEQSNLDKKLHRLDPRQREEALAGIATTLANERDIQFAYAFGSAITEPVFHDIDVAVYLSGPVPTHRDRCLELAEQLTRNVGVPVDVQPLAEAPIAFAFHVFRGQLLFSRDDERLADLLEDTVRRYLDVEPLVRRATREAFAQ